MKEVFFLFDCLLAAGLFLVAYFVKRAEAQKLRNRHIAIRLEGTCFVSEVEVQQSSGAYVSLKNNLVKYRIWLPSTHAGYEVVAKSGHSFVAVKLVEAPGQSVADNLAFEFLYEHNDALEILLRAVEKALHTAQESWPRAGGNPFAELLGRLNDISLPLDRERTLRALAYWVTAFGRSPQGALTEIGKAIEATRMYLRAQKYEERESKARLRQKAA